VREAINFSKRGVAVEAVSLPHTEYAVPFITSSPQPRRAPNLVRYDGVKYGFRSKGITIFWRCTPGRRRRVWSEVKEDYSGNLCPVRRILRPRTTERFPGEDTDAERF